jgi:hypothetical protein
LAFNSHVRGAEGDGLASVAEGEKKRRPSGTDARAKELARGIGAAAMPAEGGGSCSCSGKKKVKAAFQFFMFSEVRNVNLEGANAEVGCWASWPQLGHLLLGHNIRMAQAEEEWAARVSLGQNREFRLGCQKRIERGFRILAAKLNLTQDNFEFKSKDIFKVKLQFKLKIKFKTFTNGNLGFVSKIEIKTRTLNQRVSIKTKQDFEIQSLNLLE